MKKTFSIAAVALTLIAGGYPIQQVETTYKTVEVGPATIEIERTGSDVSMQVEGIPDDGELSVSRGSTQISEVEEGLFRDNLAKSSGKGTYTFSLESPMSLDSELVLSGKINPKDVDDYVNLDVVSVEVPLSASDTMAAFAASPLPTRTRLRYQTFIPEYDTDAPPLVCAPISTGDYILITNFLGDNRSWNPDSESFKTRSDVVIDWGAGGSITPEFSVGETSLVLEYIFPFGVGNTTVVQKRTAADDSMKLERKVMSSSYVSFKISSDVSNPFCFGPLVNGIFYEFAFSVYRDGVYTIKGSMIKVPSHEFYTRNNVDPSWRTLFRFTNQGFQCLTKGWVGCIVPKEFNGDLVQ